MTRSVGTAVIFPLSLSRIVPYFHIGCMQADDDIDEKGRRLFNLDPSDVIISVHTCSWHHEPKITDGHVLLTRKNVCFMGNAESPVLIKIPWKEV